MMVHSDMQVITWDIMIVNVWRASMYELILLGKQVRSLGHTYYCSKVNLCMFTRLATTISAMAVVLKLFRSRTH